MLSCGMRGHPLPCGMWAPGNSVCPQPPGSGEGKDDFLLFLAASCLAALERPCWFSQSRRAPKHRESGLPGCMWRAPPWALELPVPAIERRKQERRDTAARCVEENFFWGLWAAAESGLCREAPPSPADCAVSPAVQKQMQDSTCMGMAPPTLIATQASLLNTLPR